MDLNIGINKQNPTPVYLQIKNQIKSQILNNELLNGFRLTSERKLAEALSIHRNTVIKAYRELIAEGLVQVLDLPHAYVVAYDASIFPYEKKGHEKHFSSFDYMVKDEFVQFNLMFSKLFYSSINPKEISFAGQVPSRELYPAKEVREILNELIQENNLDLFDFCDNCGLESLRVHICTLLAKKNIHANPSEIQIVSETTQALDYILKLYMYPRDVIVVEEPVFTDSMNLFKLMGIKVVGVPVDKNGMVTSYLEQVIIKYKPKFIYTIPYFHNPTTTVMSLERRLELLNLSYKYNIPIIEEDCVSDFRFEGPNIPTLKAMDNKNNVIYIASFLYSLFPGLRVAYVAAPKEVCTKISQLLGIEQLSISSIGQHITSRFIEKGFYDKHLNEVRSFYRKKRDLICNELKKIAGTSFDIPTSGTCIWYKLPNDLDQVKLMKTANTLGISFIPGYLFFPYGNQGDNYIRLSYSNSSDEDIVKGVALLAKSIALCREQP